MMDEAASNPNFVLEKQAELKKGTKKGKKWQLFKSLHYLIQILVLN